VIKAGQIIKIPALDRCRASGAATAATC